MSAGKRGEKSRGSVEDVLDRWLTDQLKAAFDHLAAMPIPRPMLEAIEEATRQREAAGQSGTCAAGGDAPGREDHTATPQGRTGKGGDAD